MLLFMAKVDWAKLQLQFWYDHSQTHVGAKAWCDKHQLNYNTARRYLKVRAVKESIKRQVASNPIVKARKVFKHRGAPFGSQNALKHGGYSKYFYNELGQMVEAINAEDDLLLCRTRIQLVLINVRRIQQALEQKLCIEMVSKLYDDLLRADLAIDKNIARIQAITKKASSRRLDGLGKT